VNGIKDNGKRSNVADELIDTEPWICSDMQWWNDWWFVLVGQICRTGTALQCFFKAGGEWEGEMVGTVRYRSA
jgi:hypothetical protein